MEVGCAVADCRLKCGDAGGGGGGDIWLDCYRVVSRNFRLLNVKTQAMTQRCDDV